jgi:pimeloyl-ACP methyl ester carboxylesterase
MPLQGEGHLTQAERLAAAVRRHAIPVLIVHGSSDVLVPAANSRRLAALLPGAQLVEFEGCGHMPQEECPDRFVDTVRSFVLRLS